MKAFDDSAKAQALRDLGWSERLIREVLGASSLDELRDSVSIDIFPHEQHDSAVASVTALDSANTFVVKSLEP